MSDLSFMRQLFPAAELEAAALGDEVPGPEHLLLAALQMPDDPTAREALHDLGIAAEDFRAAVGRVHQDALSAVGLSAERGLASPSGGVPRHLAGLYRASGAAGDVFQRAVALTREGPRVPLRAAHVLIAAAEAEYGTAARALASLGADPRTVVRTAQALLSTGEQ